MSVTGKRGPRHNLALGDVVDAALHAGQLRCSLTPCQGTLECGTSVGIGGGHSLCGLGVEFNNVEEALVDGVELAPEEHGSGDCQHPRLVTLDLDGLKV